MTSLDSLVSSTVDSHRGEGSSSVTEEPLLNERPKRGAASMSSRKKKRRAASFRVPPGERSPLCDGSPYNAPGAKQCTSVQRVEESTSSATDELKPPGAFPSTSTVLRTDTTSPF